jgi:hypothetical protein
MDITQLMTCFCKTREIQSLYTNLLHDKELSQEERELIVGLVQCAADSSKKIKNLCNSEKDSSNEVRERYMDNDSNKGL